MGTGLWMWCSSPKQRETKARVAKKGKEEKFQVLFQFKSASKTNEREIPIQDTAMWLGS